jgi:uncharacterized protein (TIGR04255 family)
MQITHLGLFWDRIRRRFPHVEQHPALGPVKEVFDHSLIALGPTWLVSQQPEFPRAWFLSDESPEGQHLIQLQQDRFLGNWRRGSLDTQTYPSYSANRAEFEKALDDFTSFSKEQGLGEVSVNQCEVTYVNHIPVEEGLSYGQMFRRCFPSLSGEHSDDFLPKTPERSAYTCSYPIESRQGRLHIEVVPAVHKKTKSELIRLTLTARGSPASTNRENVIKWLDLGHDWVVNGFMSFTGREMHLRWGIIERENT